MENNPEIFLRPSILIPVSSTDTLHPPPYFVYNSTIMSPKQTPAFLPGIPLTAVHSSFTPPTIQSNYKKSSWTILRATATPTTPQRAKTQPYASASGSRLADQMDCVPPQLRPSLLRLPEDAEIAELGARHTKVIATIGPSSCDFDGLLRLAAGGMNIARLNLCHGDYAWHEDVIEHIRQINITTPFVAGVLVDLGSYDSVRLGQFARNPVLAAGDTFTLTSRHEAEYPEGVTEVSTDGFIDIVREGDLIQCQAEGGGAVELLAKEINGPDIVCEVVSPGEMRSRASISIRGKSLNLNPKVPGEDLNASIARAVLGCPPDQLEFAIQQRVEYVALSFVEGPDQIMAIRGLLRDRGANIGVVAKIESANALRNLESIVAAADAVMVARGDLGSSIQYEKVPYWQQMIADECRRHGKPCMISTHFLESMVLYPTPTRAEVTDMTEAVKQRVDALVLTAETASGRFPYKAMSTMNSVLMRIQRRIHEIEAEDSTLDIPPLVKDTTWWTPGVGDVAENIASTAAVLANQQNAAAILVFTQKGLMATLTSRCRPKAPIFAFTATPVVRNKLNLLYGVRPFRCRFEDDPEETIANAMTILKDRKAVKAGEMVIVLADVLGGRVGATDMEVKAAFDDISKGSRFITASEVRNALRIMGLKVGDRLEAKLGMRDVDVKEAGMEEMIKKGQPVDDFSDTALGRYDLDRFQEFASQAKEIVHTLQLRYVN